MIKKIALVLALTVITAYTTTISLAAAKQQRSMTVSSPVYAAISKYKQKNYVGCIQDLIPVVEKDDNNAVAHYYMGIAYAQLGMKSEAQNSYQKVIGINADTKLTEYSKRAIACLNGRPECSANYVDKNAPVDDMTVFIKSGKFLDDSVKQQIQEKALEKQKDRINNDLAPDVGNYKLLNDASSEIKAQPTDKEIADAVKVLAKVGVNPFI